MAAWKLLLVAMKARRGWKRIPPAQRRALFEAAQRTARKQAPAVAASVRKRGPVVAKRVAAVVKTRRSR